MSPDNTTYQVEAYDPRSASFGLSDNSDLDQNWIVVGDKFEYDTFTDASIAAVKAGRIYRTVRIKQVTVRDVALYQDGVIVE